MGLYVYLDVVSLEFTPLFPCLFETAQLHARCNMMQGKKRRDMERERKKRIIRYSLILNRLWKKCKIIADNSIVASIDERLIIDSKINIFC